MAYSFRTRAPGRARKERHLPSSVYMEALRRLVPPLLTDDGRPRVWEEKTLRPGIGTYMYGTWFVRRAIPEVSTAEEYAHEGEYELAWAGALRGTQAGERWVCDLAPHAESSLKLLHGRATRGFTGWDGHIDDPRLAEEIRKALGSGTPISPSRLETYATCPFRYFAIHVLGLEKLPEPAYEIALDAAQAGKLLHGLLARYFRHLRDSGIPLGRPRRR